MKTLLIISLLLCFGCTTNKKVLAELKLNTAEIVLVKQGLRQLDSTYRSTNIQLYKYEKNRIDTTNYDKFDNDELIKRAMAIIKN